jgi:hypothetical protein
MPIALYSPRISRFSFSGYTFVWINRQTDVSLPEGFYRQLVTGKVTVMSRTNKIISERIVDNMIARKFEEKTLYYIFRDGKYFQIGNQKHLVQVLKDRKKEVKRFIKDKKMIYHDNPEEMIVSVVSFYNQL